MAIGYETVPLHHGPQWSERPKDKIEFLLNLLALLSGLACMITPVIALANYPQGFLIEPVMTLEKAYVFLFGGLVFILEAGHGGSQALLELQNSVYKNFRLLERLTGKGLFLIFLGCNSWNILNPDTQSMELQILFVIVGFSVSAVGVIHMIVGIQKMVVLERIRRKLQSWRHEGKPILPDLENINPGETYLLDRLNNRENLDKFLLTFAVSHAGKSQEIMLDTEFNSLAQTVLGNTSFNFTPWEIDLVVTSIAAGGEGESHLSTITGELGLPHTPLLFFDAIYEWLCPGAPLLI